MSKTTPEEAIALAKKHQIDGIWSLPRIMRLGALIDEVRAAPPNAPQGDEVSDAERFVWWFTEDESKSEFLDAYLEGVTNKWNINDWRKAIDGAKAKHSAALRAAQKG